MKRIVFAFLFFGVLGGACSALEGADSALPEIFNEDNVLWEVELGTHQYTIPKVDGGQIFLGVDDSALEHPAVKRTRGGVLMCLDQKSGKMMWQLAAPRNMAGTFEPFKATTGGAKVGKLKKIWQYDCCPKEYQIRNGKRIAYSGKMHCIDAVTGKSYWAHQMDAGVWTCSAVEVNGIILISTEKRRTLWAFKAGRKKTVVGKCRMKSESITPVFADGVMYFPTQKRIFAMKVDAGLIKEGKDK